MMKKVIKIMFIIISFLSYGYLLFLLTDFGFLNNNVVLLVAFLLFTTLLVFSILIFRLKNKLIKIIICILVFLIIITSLLGTYYFKKTIYFIRNLKSNDEYNYYYVMVLNNNVYTNLSDIKNKDLGYINDEYDIVKEKFNIAVNDIKYDSLDSILEALYKKNIDAVLLSDSDTYILEENNEDFSYKTKVIYTIKIRRKVGKTVKKSAKEPFIIYISGIDTYGEISRVSRSDVNIIVTVNPKDNKALLTTIPRDYYVQLHGTTGIKDKLTHSGIYGVDMSIKTIEDLLDIDIDYYVRVNFSTLVKLIDELGGVDVYSEKEFIPYTDKTLLIPSGMVHMDGRMALAFARERYAYDEGDRHRGENQEEIIKGLIEKIQSSPLIIAKYSSILGVMEKDFETNIDDYFIKSMIKLQMKNMPKWNVEVANLNGFDSKNYTYSGGDTILYVMEPDYTVLNNVKNKIDSILDSTKE